MLMQPVAPQIFISHARVDARFADGLERTLTTWGSRPWIDRQQLGGGQEWPVALQQAIDHSAALVVVLTPNALRSPMVQREYLYALSRRLPVLLIRFRDVGPLPPPLADVPVLDFRRGMLRAGAALYVALADLRLIPPPPETQLDTVTPDAFFRVMMQRAPADWQIWRLAAGIHAAIGAGALLLSIALIALSFVPTSSISHLYQALPGYLSFSLTVATPPLAIFSGIVLLVPGVLHLSAALGLQPRDTIILTPDSVNVQVFQAARLRTLSQPHRYLFRFISQASMERDALGRVSLLFTNAVNHQVMRVRIPWRWPDRQAIAERIVQAVNSYHQRMMSVQPAQPAIPAPAPPMMPAPIAETLAPTIPRPPSAAPPPQPQPASANAYPQATMYTVLAAEDQQKLVNMLQSWLGQRGIIPGEMARDRGLILPTARGAAWSRFVLVFITSAVLQSPNSQAILADLRRQGKLIIPIRLNAATLLPPDLAAVQWVDFSPEIDPARSLIDLCITLDRAGIPFALPPNVFDGTLALARGIHQQTPADWRVFRPDSTGQRVYRMRLLNARLSGVALGVVGVLLLIFFGAIINIFHPATSGEWGTAFGVAIAGLVLVGLLSSPFLWRLINQARAARFWSRLTRDATVPECVVVTPLGIAFHVVQARQRAAFIDGGYAFAALRAVERHDTFFGTPQLRLVFTTGAHQDVPLITFGGAADQAIAQAMAAWSAYATWVQMPAMGAVMSPLQ